MALAIAVLGALTFLAVLKVLQPTLLDRSARLHPDGDLAAAGRFARRRDVVVPLGAFCVCATASGSAFVRMDASWPFWAAGAVAALALGAAVHGARPRTGAVLRAHGVTPEPVAHYPWYDATAGLFALTWVVRLLATHPAIQQVGQAQVVLLPVLTVCAGVAAWKVMRD